jgi:cytochrome c
MTRLLPTALLGIVLASVIAGPVRAHSPEEVQKLVERAADHIRQYGRDQAFADFSRPDGGFVEGDLYIFCQDASGVVLAHGGNPKIIGRNMSGVRGPDGRYSNVEINQLGLTQGHGWLEYLWPNPAAGRVQLKISYVLRIDSKTVCGSGYYKSDPP